MSDEAAPSSSAAISSLDQDALYLFTGAEVEALLLEAAGMVSTAMLPPEKVMPEDEIRLALSVGCLDHDGLKDAGTKGALLKRPVPSPAQIGVLLDRPDAQAAADALRSFAEENPTPYVETVIEAITQSLREPVTGMSPPPPSTQPQFGLGDTVTIDRVGGHALPPLLEDFPMPMPGEIVREADDAGLVEVRVELPSPHGSRRVQLHVDQIESAPPSQPETPR